MTLLRRIALTVGAILIMSALAAKQARASSILLHSYDFNGGVIDLTGSANGTLVGGATATGVLALNGTTAYAQFSSHIVPTSGSFSVALSAQEFTRSGLFVELISQGFTTGPGFYIGHDPSGVIRAGDGWINTGVVFPSDQQWHHYALVVDSAANRSYLYLDGTLQATLLSAVAQGTGGSDTRLGRQFGTFNEFFNGNLDNLRIYDGALTSEEVAALASSSEVPEPASLVLFGAGLLALHSRLRRQPRCQGGRS